MNTSGLHRRTVRRGRRHGERRCDCHAIERAIDRGQLELHYQPIVELSRDLVVGLEALVRWRHPTEGLLTAGGFVPRAEACGLVRRVDEWVLDRAVRQIAEWQDDVLIGPGFRIAVNVSGLQFADGSLADRVAASLRRHGADPECLTIELTETIDLVDLDAAHRTMRGLQRLGVEVALDDFGAAYATFQRLRFLPFDELKIDREVMAAATSPVGTAFVRAVVELGAGLGMRVVAEGVEARAQANAARHLGCDLAQGYLWGAAAPAEHITQLLQSGCLTGLEPAGEPQADAGC